MSSRGIGTEGVVLTERDIHDDVDRVDVARCLSQAFSSGLWTSTPMPLGSPKDPASALGVLAGLGKRPVVLAARGDSSDDRTIGCVVGSVLDSRSIAEYGLGPFEAGPGDGLLAFIGIVPEAQRMRVPAGQRCISLARLLFERWLSMTSLSGCGRIYIRTRAPIRQVIRLCSDNGFEYCGRFLMDFRGQPQERLVYRRYNPDGTVRTSLPETS